MTKKQKRFVEEYLIDLNATHRQPFGRGILRPRQKRSDVKT